MSDMSRIVEDAQRSLRAQIDRMRVFVSRAVLDRGPPSPVVDFHALRLLVKHLSRHDIAALGRSLGSPRIDLDDVRARPEPSFLRPAGARLTVIRCGGNSKP